VSDPFGLVGQVLESRYRVDACVGEGGFGVVYRATHTTFGEPRALKLLKVPAHFAAATRDAFVKKFVAEGQLVRKLARAHPAVVEIEDVGVVAVAGQTVPYLALEWLEGETLDEHVARRGPLGEREAIDLLAPAIDAIARAHEGAVGQVVAHRDIKPQNLFVTKGPGDAPTVRVLDFGIAKVMQEGDDATRASTGATSTFAAFSPTYGAPEQFNPDDFGATGPRTDVHAIGLVLGFSLSGQPPFKGKSVGALTLEALADRRPTPRALGAQVSDALEAVCARALARAPAERYASAGELGVALRELRAAAPAEPSHATPAPRDATPRADPMPSTVLGIPAFGPEASRARPASVVREGASAPDAWPLRTELGVAPFDPRGAVLAATAQSTEPGVETPAPRADEPTVGAVPSGVRNAGVAAAIAAAVLFPLGVYRALDELGAHATRQRADFFLAVRAAWAGVLVDALTPTVLLFALASPLASLRTGARASATGRALAEVFALLAALRAMYALALPRLDEIGTMNVLGSSDAHGFFGEPFGAGYVVIAGLAVVHLAVQGKGIVTRRAGALAMLVIGGLAWVATRVKPPGFYDDPRAPSLVYVLHGAYWSAMRPIMAQTGLALLAIALVALRWQAWARALAGAREELR
jgi:serine/threonine-protein kinase